MPDPVKWFPRKQELPRLTERLIVDTYRGQVRVRAWPRKAGKPTSPAIIEQRDFIRAMNRFFNYWAPSQRAVAEQWARNTPLMPRDIFMLAQQGKLIDIHLPDGRVIHGRRPTLEETVFQGATLQRTSNVTLIGGAMTTIGWPLPVIDTFEFWNVANPERLTIPAGIEIIQLTAGARLDTAGAEALTQIIDQTGAQVARWIDRGGGAKAHYLTSPPLNVQEGDYFRLQVRTSEGGTYLGIDPNHFTLTVLQALTNS